MKHWSLLSATTLLSIGTIAGALDGCTSTNAVQALPQANPSAERTHHPVGLKSWAAAGLGPQNLLYVSNSNGLVNVYRYWQKNLVGVLTDFSKPMGMCVDNQRDVYIADYGAKTVVEYAHGGSKPIRTIDVAPYAPYGCAVDPTTGDLAVANYQTPQTYTYYNDTGDVAIYKHAKGKPIVYGGGTGCFTTLSYDDYGDLLATNLYYYYYGFFSDVDFYYLPKHGTKLLKMDLPNSQLSTSSYGWPAVQSINYDGSYWVVTARNTMYRYTIGVKAQEVDYMELTGASGYVGELWLYRKNLKAQATQVVAGDSTYNDANTVDYWKYPVTGDPLATITSGLDDPYGVTVSLRTSK